jgi:hypothetical protein
LLREPAHTFTTEAIAMMMGRLSTNGEWMKAMGIIDEKEAEKVKPKVLKCFDSNNWYLVVGLKLCIVLKRIVRKSRSGFK